MDAIGDKKGLDDEYVKYVSARYKILQTELRQIQRESFVVPQEIKSKGLSLPPVIRRTLSLDTDKMQSDSERGAIGRVLGMNIGIEQWTNDSATYIAKAQGIVDANARIKNSVGEIALAAGEAMGATIAHMAIGTATITDLANSLLATVGNIFADILKQMALAEVKALGIKALLGDPTALLRVVGLSVGAGLLGAFSSKIGQNRAGNQMQRMPTQSNTSQLRGGDLYWSQKRYETITGF